MRLPLKPAVAGLLLAVGFPVASAATLGVAAGTLGAGRGVPGACLSAATTVVRTFRRRTSKASTSPASTRAAAEAPPR